MSSFHNYGAVGRGCDDEICENIVMAIPTKKRINPELFIIKRESLNIQNGSWKSKGQREGG